MSFQTTLFTGLLLAGNFLALNAQTNTVLLPAETPLLLTLAETLHSDSLTTGMEIEVEVSSDLKVDEEVIISKGTKVKARIIVANPEVISPTRMFIEPYACTAVDGQEITLGGPAAVFNAAESGMEVVVQEGTEIQSEIYITYTVSLGGEEDPAPGEMPAVAVEGTILPAGLEMDLVISDEVILSEIEEGDTVRLRVKADVVVGGVVVIHAKAPATGFVKRLVGNRLYVSASTVTTTDGAKVYIESDHSVIVTLDAENEDELQVISGDLKAMVTGERRVVRR